jgi:hypothetical protein
LLALPAWQIAWHGATVPRMTAPTPRNLRAALAALEIDTSREPRVADETLFRAGEVARQRAEQGHKAYHEAAVIGGLVVAELRSRGMSWRAIDKATNIAPRTAARWMKVATEGGDYVEAGRDE